MTNEHHGVVSPRLLIGLVLLLWSAPVAAQDSAAAVPDSTIHQEAPAVSDSATSGALSPAQRDSDFRVSISSESGDGIDSFFELISFAILLLLLIAGASVFAGGFAAVSIFMDTGCLRLLIAALGWGIAVLSGLVVGLIAGSALGGIEAFLLIGLFGSGFLYLAAWHRGHQHAQQLSETDRLTWKHTLTGGALIGAGAGSAASLARSAGALFKGGGGSFGGGGASGAFGGAQASAAAPGAIAWGAADASDSSPESAPSRGVATRLRPAVANEPASEPAESSAPPWRLWMRAAVRPLQRFRWYHGVAFVLVGIVFMPVGMGLSALLQSGHLLLGLTLVGGCLWAFVQFMTTERYGEFRGLGVIVLLPLIAASIWAAHHSTAPYWHLGLVVAGILAVALYRARERGTLRAEPDGAPPFGGGSASDRW
jgi:hypothetical protein